MKQRKIDQLINQIKINDNGKCFNCAPLVFIIITTRYLSYVSCNMLLDYTPLLNGTIWRNRNFHCSEKRVWSFLRRSDELKTRVCFLSTGVIQTTLFKTTHSPFNI